MKKTMWLILLLVSFAGQALSSELMEANRSQFSKEKMIIEGIINDYILRIKAKDELAFIFDFDYWTNALTGGEIIVYIYARPPIPKSHNKYSVVEKEIKNQFEELKTQLVSGVSETILAWPEFNQFKNYKVEVILRIEEKITKALLESYLNKILSSK